MHRPTVEHQNVRQASGAGKPRLAITTEDRLWLVAIGCAIFLLFGIVSDRTSYGYGKRGNTSTTDAAGYNIVALFSGVVAIAGLSVAFVAHPSVVPAVIGATAAIAAFGLSVYFSGIYWLARLRGEVYFYGTGDILEYDPRATVHPAVGPPFFATAALIGAVATLVLVVIWLRQARRG